MTTNGTDERVEAIARALKAVSPYPADTYDARYYAAGIDADDAHKAAQAKEPERVVENINDLDAMADIALATFHRTHETPRIQWREIVRAVLKHRAAQAKPDRRKGERRLIGKTTPYGVARRGDRRAPAQEPERAGVSREEIKAVFKELRNGFGEAALDRWTTEILALFANPINPPAYQELWSTNQALESDNARLKAEVEEIPDFLLKIAGLEGTIEGLRSNLKHRPAPFTAEQLAEAWSNTGGKPAWVNLPQPYRENITQHAQMAIEWLETNKWVDGLSAPSPLVIEAGGYYRTRDGRKVGPMEYWPDRPSDEMPWKADIGGAFRWWTVDGKYSLRGDNLECDLIAPWIEPSPQPEPSADLDRTLGANLRKALERLEYIVISLGPSKWSVGNGVICFYGETLDAALAKLANDKEGV